MKIFRGCYFTSHLPDAIDNNWGKEKSKLKSLKIKAGNELSIGALKSYNLFMGIKKAMHMCRIVHMLMKDMKSP